MYLNCDFLLLGKSGNGKSSTGNSILQWNLFPVGNDMSSKTSDADSGCGRFNEFALKVVDMPGPMDTRVSKEEQSKHLAEKLYEAIQLNPEGFHAFLFVVKFGNRWTEKEQDVVDMLKKLLAPDIVKNYCILVMTGGDNFERDEQDFDTWCGAQTGPFKDLLNECGGRVVLFDNKTTDKNKKDRQTNELLRLVDSLPSRGERYTDDNFKAAAIVRETYLVECESAVYSEEVQCKVQDILQKVSLGELTKAEYKQLDVKITVILKEIREKDKGAGVLKGLVEKVESLKATLANLDDAEKLRKAAQDIAEEVRIEHNKIRQSFRKGLTYLGLSAAGVAASIGLSVAAFFVGGPVATAVVVSTSLPTAAALGAGAALLGGGSTTSAIIGVLNVKEALSLKAKIVQKMKKMFGQDQDDQGKQN